MGKNEFIATSNINAFYKRHYIEYLLWASNREGFFYEVKSSLKYLVLPTCGVVAIFQGSYFNKYIILLGIPTV